MEADSSSFQIGERILVRVVLPPNLGEYAHGEAASIVFEVPECKEFRRELLTGPCRGVRLDRLANVLQHGIDVQPADAPIWVSSLDKAMEYGGWPKLVLVLNLRRLESTFLELPESAGDAARALARQRYPTEVVSTNGHSRWFSRLPADDPRLGSGYEESYARWIPKDAMQAVKALIIVEHPRFGERVDWQQLETVLQNAGRSENRDGAG